ncbi:MAG: oligoendopeptidase F, partial [Calditrichales bacterium]
MTEKRLEVSRDKIEEMYKWDLGQLFDTVTAWEQRKKEIASELEKIASFKGTLTRSGEDLFTALTFLSNLTKEFLRLYAYASMWSDQDTRESKPMQLRQEMTPLQTQLSALSAFVEPEILTLTDAQLAQFYHTEPRLETYHQYISDILRRREHTL